MFAPEVLRSFINKVDVDMRGLTAQQAVAAMVKTAEIAKQRVTGAAQARSSGVTPGVLQVVDGVRDAPLTAVRPDGEIRLLWNYVAEVAQDTMDALIARSPVETGDYIRGLKMYINGQEVKDARWETPPAGTVVIQIVATVPYARRLEIGLAHGHPPTRHYFVKQVMPHIVEETMMASRSLYGQLAKFEYNYMQLPDPHMLASGSASIRTAHGRRVTEISHPTITITARVAAS